MGCVRGGRSTLVRRLRVVGCGMRFSSLTVTAFSLLCACAHSHVPLTEPARITDPAKAVTCPKGTELSRGVSFQTYISAWCQRPDGVKHGEFVDWWENGNKKSAGMYREGRREGVWTFFRETGQVDSQIEYRDGVALGAGGVPMTTVDPAAGVSNAPPPAEPGTPVAK